jgi:hypothetical protein
LAREGAVAAADREAILAAARDYIEAWLDGDPDRMARCLHPELAKRSVQLDDTGAGCTVENLTRDVMVAATSAGRGTIYERPYQLSILDAYGDCASIRVLSTPYVDYLHVARCGDRWLLVNVLWQWRIGRWPKDAADRA